jgi:hypothetical protein
MLNLFDIPRIEVNGLFSIKCDSSSENDKLSVKTHLMFKKL